MTLKGSLLIPADYQPSQTNVNSKLVRCIPDSLPLTESGRSVLSKVSLSLFDPLQASTILYCERFFRTLRWMAVLRKVPRPSSLSEQDDIFTHLFQTHHYREPPHGKFVDVELYIAKCHKEIQNLRSKPLQQLNLTRAEEMALQSLMSRQDIIIKPADKGNAVVVWDRDLYIAEAHRQLDDNSAY